MTYCTDEWVCKCEQEHLRSTDRYTKVDDDESPTIR